MKRTILIVAIAISAFAIQLNAQTIQQTNIIPINSALNTVVQLQPIQFSFEKDWAQKLKLPTSRSGFNIANLRTTNPELIVNQYLNYTSGKNNNQTAIVQQVDYDTLIPLLVGSIKEQQAQIEALKAEINTLKTKSAK